MSRLFRAVCLVVVLAVLMAGLGCGSAASGREKLYGKWDYTSNGNSYLWDFKQDGVLFIHQGTALFETTYVFVDDDTITVKVPQENGEQWTFDFKIEDGKLSLTANGITQVLIPVQDN